MAYVVKIFVLIVERSVPVLLAHGGLRTSEASTMYSSQLRRAVYDRVINERPEQSHCPSPETQQAACIDRASSRDNIDKFVPLYYFYQIPIYTVADRTVPSRSQLLRSRIGGELAVMPNIDVGGVTAPPCKRLIAGVKR